MKKFLNKMKTTSIQLTFPCFMLIISLPIFLIAINFIRLSDNILYTIMFLLLFAMPSILFYILTKLKSKRKVKSWIITVLTTLLSCTLLSYYIIISFIALITLTKDPITDPAKYNLIRGECFPEKIPITATQTKIHYNPALLQGGSFTGLYYIDTKASFEQQKIKIEKNNIWNGTYAELQNKHSNITHMFHFVEDDITKENFHIYIISQKCDSSEYCNHGSYLTLALNDITRQIIYSHETW